MDLVFRFPLPRGFPAVRFGPDAHREVEVTVFPEPFWLEMGGAHSAFCGHARRKIAGAGGGREFEPELGDAGGDSSCG